MGSHREGGFGLFLGCVHNNKTKEKHQSCPLTFPPPSKFNQHLVFTAGVSVILSTPCKYKYTLLIPPACPSSVEHIVGNLVMQLLLGIPLELVHKGFEVGMVYLAGVLAGEHHLSSLFPLHVR